MGEDHDGTGGMMDLLRSVDPGVLEIIYLGLLGLATLAILAISAFVVVALFRGQR